MDKQPDAIMETGIAPLDEELGGIHYGDVVVIAGRAGSGKTSLSLAIAEHVSVAEDRAILIIPLEMEAEDVAPRMLTCRITAARVLGKDTGDEMRDVRNEGELIKVAESAVGPIIGNVITQTRILSKSGVDVGIDDVIDIIRDQNAQIDGGISLVVVDFLQLIRPDDTSESMNRAAQMQYIVDRLKEVAEELQLGVLLMAQVYTEDDTLEGLLTNDQFRAIANATDKVIFISKGEPDANEYYPVRIDVFKGVDNPIEEVDVVVDYQTMNFDHD